MGASLHVIWYLFDAWYLRYIFYLEIYLTTSLLGWQIKFITSKRIPSIWRAFVNLYILSHTDRSPFARHQSPSVKDQACWWWDDRERWRRRRWWLSVTLARLGKWHGNNVSRRKRDQIRSSASEPGSDALMHWCTDALMQLPMHSRLIR